MRVFSGKCCLCDVGISAQAKSTYGDLLELHTGDIIMIYHGRYIGTDSEEWMPSGNLTAVVANQYQSYANAPTVENKDFGKPYAMGIKNCGFDSPEWRIQVVKKYTDVVDGENWPDFGFSYKEVKK